MYPRPTCTFWLEGKCRFGDACQYVHGNSASKNGKSGDEPSKQNPGCCPYFRTGTCKFGDTCRLQHIPAETISSTPVPALPKPFGPCKFFAQGRCNKTDCPFPHMQLETNGTRTQSPHTATPGLFTTISSRELDRESCRFFMKGRCTRPACPYLHDTGEAPPGALTAGGARATSPKPSNDSHSVVLLERSAKTATTTHHSDAVPQTSNENDLAIRDYSGCKVHFGPGAAIQKLITAFESRTVIVLNVPADASRHVFVELAETFGEIVSLTFDGTAARIEYIDEAEAAYAVEGLSDREVGQFTLSARFDLRVVAINSAMLRSTKVKVSWYAPSTVAWAHYAGLSQAKAAADRLDRQTFHGRQIHAKFQSLTYYRRGQNRGGQSYSVVLEGLSPMSTAETAHLKSFAHARNIVLGDPSYINSVAIDRIRDLLTGYGHLDSFDVMPSSNRTSTKITAWVQFASSEDAARAVDKLHNSRQDFLRNGPLWLEQIHAVKYLLPRAQFEVLRAQLDRLSATTDGCCQLRYYDSGEGGVPVDPVCVRVYGPDAKSLSWTKRALEKAVQGEKIVNSDGSAAWHDGLATLPGRTSVDRLQSDTGTFVRIDPRFREIRVCGGELEVAQATRQILTRIEEMMIQQHVIEVQKSWLKILLEGGFREIQDDLSEELLVFDIVARTITVKGDENDVARVRRAIDRLLSARQGSSIGDGEDTCPVCFCEPDDPTTLTCGHAYDTECLRHLLKAAIATDTTPFDRLSCVKETEDAGQICGTPISLSIIRSLLSPDEESRLFDVSFRSYINSHPHDFHYCPTADCPTIYRPSRPGTVLLCPNCLDRVCPNCHAEYHEGLTCREFKAGMTENSKMFEQWKAENGVKTCPGCGADIQKNGGCNHIRCTACRIHICWVCMKTFKDGDGGMGVYPHMRAAHGGYGVERAFVM